MGTNSRDNHVSLGKQVERWTTLKSRDMDAESIAHGLERNTPNLTTQVAVWDTVTVSDSKNNANASRVGRDTQGLNLQAAGSPGDKLNPDWCEQLMGFPTGWTDPDVQSPQLTAADLLCHRWPAPPGPQLDHEAPRTTGRIEYRRQRIKALGNAVVPQVAYPIFAALHERLTEAQDLQLIEAVS